MATAPRFSASTRQRFSDLLSSRSRHAIWATLILAALPFLLLMFYAVPAADDFCKASLSFNGEKQRSISDLVQLYYWGWSPRWLTTAIQGWLMQGGHLVISYPFLLLLAVLSQIAALGYFFREALVCRFGNALFLAFLLYVVWLTALESPAESVYWLTGATEYGLSLTSALILAGLLFSHGSKWKEFLAVGLSFVIPAQHELAGVVVCIFLLAGALTAWIWRLGVRRWVLCLAAAVLSLAIVFAAPGIRAREAQDAHEPRDAAHAMAHVKHAVNKGIEWTLAPSILLAAVYAGTFVKTRESRKRATRIALGYLAGAYLLGMFLVVGLLAASEVASGLILPGRALGWLHFVFFLFLLLLVLNGRDAFAALQKSVGVRLGVIALLMLTILASANFRAAVHDLRGPASAWRQANLERLGAHGPAAVWQPLPERPKLLMDSELQGNPAWWTNRCMANYMGMQSIVVAPASPK